MQYRIYSTTHFQAVSVTDSHNTYGWQPQTKIYLTYFKIQVYSKCLSGFVIRDTLEIGVCAFFLFNITLQVFVAYLTGAPYVHPL